MIENHSSYQTVGCKHTVTQKPSCQLHDKFLGVLMNLSCLVQSPLYASQKQLLLICEAGEPQRFFGSGILASLSTSSSWPTTRGNAARFTGFHLDILNPISSYKYSGGRNTTQRSTLTSNPSHALMAAVFFPFAAANMRRFIGGTTFHTRLIITWETSSLSKGLSVCAWDSEKTSITPIERWQTSNLRWWKEMHRTKPLQWN